MKSEKAFAKLGHDRLSIKSPVKELYEDVLQKTEGGLML